MTVKVDTLTEGGHLVDVVVGERSGHLSREEVTILAGSGSARALVKGQVVGLIPGAAAVAAADGENTGNGTISAVTVGGLVKAGVYTLTCIAEATGAGTFQVVDPDGNLLPNLTVAVAYSGDHIGLTVADGAEDWDAGDIITVTVTPAAGKVVALDFSASTGGQFAYGIMIDAYSAPDGSDAPGVAIVRDADILASGLVWPDGATAAQKADALARLAAKGITIRQEAN